MRACLCGGGHRLEGLKNHLRSYTLFLVYMYGRHGHPYMQVYITFLNQIEWTRKRKLWPLCVKSLRARACLLVRRWAQAGRFGKPPRKLHSSSVVSHKVLLDHHSYRFFLKNLAAKNYRHPKSFFFFSTHFMVGFWCDGIYTTSLF